VLQDEGGGGEEAGILGQSKQEIDGMGGGKHEAIVVNTAVHADGMVGAEVVNGSAQRLLRERNAPVVISPPNQQAMGLPVCLNLQHQLQSGSEPHCPQGIPASAGFEKRNRTGKDNTDRGNPRDVGRKRNGPAQKDEQTDREHD
jgi:hypothetical protein